LLPPVFLLAFVVYVAVSVCRYGATVAAGD